MATHFKIINPKLVLNQNYNKVKDLNATQTFKNCRKQAVS